MSRLSGLLRSAVLLSTAAAAYGQHQRIALAPDEFTLSGHGASKVLDGFCLDKNLVAPIESTTYSEVLAGESRAVVHLPDGDHPLAQAISSGLVQVQVDELKVSFVNKTPNEMSIRLGEPVALGEKPGTIESSSLLDPLRGPLPPSSDTAHDAVQKAIWNANAPERNLRVLSYLDTTSYTPEKGKDAVTRFQQDRHLPVTGNLDAATKSALATEVRTQQQLLTRVGFEPYSGSDGSDLGTTIRRYEIHNGLPVTGRMTEAVRSAVQSDLARADLFRRINDMDEAPVTSVNGAGMDSVITYRNSLDRHMAWFATPQGPELWLDNGRQFSRERGEWATDLWGLWALQDAEYMSDGDAQYVYAAPRAPGEDLKLQLGGKFFSVPEKDVPSLIRGETLPAEIAAHLAALKASGEKPSLVIYRDEMLQGKGGDAGPGMAPFEKSSQRPVDPLPLAKLLSKHTDTPVYLANSMEMADDNLDLMPEFRGGRSISMWIDGHLVDKGISNVHAELKDAQIEVVEARDAIAGQRPVVLFAGHNTANFRQDVLRYAREGKFEGGVVALAVCGEPDDLAFNSRLILDSDARAVIFYDQKINPTAVQEVLARFAERLSTNGSTGDFRAVWVQSVKDVLAQPHSDLMKQNLQKLIDVLMQLSRLFGEDTNAGWG